MNDNLVVGDVVVSCLGHDLNNIFIVTVSQNSTLICQYVFKNSQPPEDHSPISRKEFVRFLLATPTKSELRCQVVEADFT